MALAIRNLSDHTYSNGMTFWGYKTTDTVEAACRQDYFTDASDMLTAKDTILIAGADGCRMVWVKQADPSGVTVAAMI